MLNSTIFFFSFIPGCVSESILNLFMFLFIFYFDDRDFLHKKMITFCKINNDYLNLCFSVCAVTGFPGSPSHIFLDDDVRSLM